WGLPDSLNISRYSKWWKIGGDQEKHEFSTILLSIATCLVRVELVANGTRLPGNGRTSNQTMKICTLHLFWLLAQSCHLFIICIFQQRLMRTNLLSQTWAHKLETQHLAHSFHYL
ncbi:unnamed protein product, partial [Heterosigma akashiwo]